MAIVHQSHRSTHRTEVCTYASCYPLIRRPQFHSIAPSNIKRWQPTLCQTILKDGKTYFLVCIIGQSVEIYLQLSKHNKPFLPVVTHISICNISPKVSYCKRAYHSYACVKGHLEPTHLKSSPLFTFSTKSLGQDSPSIHLFSKIIGSRFTTAKIKLGEDSPSWFIYNRSRFTFKWTK